MAPHLITLFALADLLVFWDESAGRVCVKYQVSAGSLDIERGFLIIPILSTTRRPKPLNT
jgi:hypothetical protein